MEMEKDNMPEGMKGARTALVPRSVALLRAASLGNDFGSQARPTEMPGL
jgi:hypothetical protein